MLFVSFLRRKKYSWLTKSFTHFALLKSKNCLFQKFTLHFSKSFRVNYYPFGIFISAIKQHSTCFPCFFFLSLNIITFSFPSFIQFQIWSHKFLQRDQHSSILKTQDSKLYILKYQNECISMYFESIIEQ